MDTTCVTSFLKNGVTTTEVTQTKKKQHNNIKKAPTCSNDFQTIPNGDVHGGDVDDDRDDDHDDDGDGDADDD